MINLKRVLFFLTGFATPLAATTISYQNFANTSGLAINGQASTALTSDGYVLRLTGASSYQSGSVFSSSPVSFASAGDSFSTFFQFRLTSPGGIGPADGLVFVLQPNSNNVGSTGSGIGFANIPNSVGIELDTFYNQGQDINNNHVAIDTNGALNNLSATAVGGLSGQTPCQSPKGVAGCMSNGDLWSVWIDYNSTNLQVAIADNSTTRPANIIKYAIDIPSILKTNTAYVGFTSATGGGWENHDIVDWQYSNTFAPIQGPVPEPCASSLLIFGLASLYPARWLMRRRVMR